MPSITLPFKWWKPVFFSTFQFLLAPPLACPSSHVHAPNGLKAPRSRELGRVFKVIPPYTSGRPAQEQIVHRPLIPWEPIGLQQWGTALLSAFSMAAASAWDNTADGTGACCRCGFIVVCVCVCLFQFRGLSFIPFPVQVICSASPAWIQIPFPLLLHS